MLLTDGTQAPETMPETQKALNKYLLNEQARIISPSIHESLKNFKSNARDIFVKN